jgi:hypothetical protein
VEILVSCFASLVVSSLINFCDSLTRQNEARTGSPPLLSSLQHLESKAVFGLVEMGRQA